MRGVLKFIVLLLAFYPAVFGCDAMVGIDGMAGPAYHAGIGFLSRIGTVTAFTADAVLGPDSGYARQSALMP